MENKGQWDNSVQFKGAFFSGAVYLQKNGFMVDLHHPEDVQRYMIGHDHAGSYSHGSRKKNKKIDYSRDISGKVVDNAVGPPEIKIRAHAYRVELVGAAEDARIVPDKPIQSYNNYFLGNDPSKWASNVSIFQAVLYKNIYPNIDIRYYSENESLKYDIIVHPGGDPSRIAFRYTGADRIQIRNKELIVKTSVGEVKELYPYTYQADDIKGRKEIVCKYVLADKNTVRFEIGEYDRNATLVIDPQLIFSSFTGSPANQYGFTATPGPDGSLFSGGIVFESGFPTTPGAYQSSFAGGGTTSPTDIGIMKFSADGSQRLYATYIGGSLNEYPHSLFSDAQGNLVVMGRSYSKNYPGTRIGPGTHPDSAVQANIVVTKLNATGTALIGSLVIGGTSNDGVNIADIQQSQSHGGTTLLRNYGDDSRSEVILDGAGNIYVAAQTQSANFPASGTGIQATLGGRQDGVVIKINPDCNGIIWATFLGGPGDDGAFVLDINPSNGNIYVGGGTTGGFPGTAPGVRHPNYQGGETDAFVAILNPNGVLQRSTYLGTSNVDIIYGLKFDRKGFPYVMGVSRGGQWPVINAAYSYPNSSQFVAKLRPDLSDFEYSTVFGSGSPKPNLSPVAFLVDRCENVYISGWGGWIQSGTDPYDQAGIRGMPVANITDNRFKSTTDNSDFYFMVIEKNASGLLFAAYFGQTGGNIGEHVDGGTSRYDQEGVIYQAMCANCGGEARFPTTPGVIGPNNGTGGRGCNLAAVKIAFNFAGVASGPKAYFRNVPDSVGCAPFTVNFRDTIMNAQSYEWNFGDGSPDTTTLEYNITHTFENVGFYQVRLIAVDSNSCNERDTAYTTIRVGDDMAALDFSTEKLEPCEELNYRFDNLSTFDTKSFTDSSFTWDFGDGSDRVVAGPTPLLHPYAEPGTYNVTLVLNDTSYCNWPDSITRQVFVNVLVDARFETPATGCAPYEALFTNTSLAGQTFEWDFGDGSPVSNEINPIHRYEQPGTYTIRMTAYDPGTCNQIDSTSMTITVAARPTAAFSYTPVTPVQNTPHIFTNLSTDGVRYKWLFGDGDSVIKNTKDTVLHQYNVSGQFEAMLITFNQAGCSDTARQIVEADILPLLDVPNAFTPGRFGRNSWVQVQGFGIINMMWKIYNRWGQVVYETNNRKSGWDGTYNGKPLPMDVYTYTLDVEFFDGTRTRKTGDITLIR